MAFDEKKERAKLKKIFDKLPENEKLLTEGLISNASFMICELEKLQQQISGAGAVEQYLHGKGQSGNIMSAATKSYLQMQKNYVQTINALTKLLPAVKEAEASLLFGESAFLSKYDKEEKLKEFKTEPDESDEEEITDCLKRMKEKLVKKDSAAGE